MFHNPYCAKLYLERSETKGNSGQLQERATVKAGKASDGTRGNSGLFRHQGILMDMDAESFRGTWKDYHELPGQCSSEGRGKQGRTMVFQSQTD